MVGAWEVLKEECRYKMWFDIIDTIKLKENRECGEIINNYYLILPSDLSSDDYKGKYKKGYYVKVIDIRCLDIFSTDIDYDYRNDLIKLGKRYMQLNLNIGGVSLNRYCYIKPK